jgi:uncharacterized protein YndB with AHSA1/START domain
MAKLESSISINAPVEKVFAYATKPENMPEYWPSMMEVKNVKELPNGGYSYDFVYKLAGVRLAGFSEDTEFVPNERHVSVSTGGIESKITYLFQPEDGGTNFAVEAEYTVPVPVLGKFAESIIVRMTEKEVEVILDNLKTVMEA